MPLNVFQLDYVRPDFALLRVVARSLIMWDSIEASEAWIARQAPAFLSELQEGAERAREASARRASVGSPARGAPRTATSLFQTPSPVAQAGSGPGAAAPRRGSVLGGAPEKSPISRAPGGAGAGGGAGRTAAHAS